MITKADAVVIGGGIIGASTAHFLTELGFGEVALVEKSTICGGSTQYSAAHVRQHYSNEVAIRLAVRGAEMFADAAERLGGPAGFVQCGYAVIAPADQEQAIRDVVPVQQSFGVQTEILSPEEVQHRWPELDVEGIALGCLRANVRVRRPRPDDTVARRVGTGEGASRLRGLHGARHHRRWRAGRGRRHG